MAIAYKVAIRFEGNDEGEPLSTANSQHKQSRKLSTAIAFCSSQNTLGLDTAAIEVDNFAEMMMDRPARLAKCLPQFHSRQGCSQFWGSCFQCCCRSQEKSTYRTHATHSEQSTSVPKRLSRITAAPLRNSGNYVFHSADGCT